MASRTGSTTYADLLQRVDRSPAAGYDQALQLAIENRVPLPGAVTPLVAETAAYLRLQESRTDQWQPLGLRYRAIAQAIDLRRDPSRYPAHQIETLSLASLDAAAIAKKLDLAAPVVQAYRGLFFEIHSRLRDAGYITQFVIVAELNAGSDRRAANRRAVEKLIAWRCGPTALDGLALTGSIDPIHPWTPAPELCGLIGDDIALAQVLLTGLQSAANSTQQLAVLREFAGDVVTSLGKGPLGRTPTNKNGRSFPHPPLTRESS